MPIRFGSVCSGIEAASVAWNPLGWQAAWFSEIEPFPCAVLKHHFPDVPNLGDMKAIPEMLRTGQIEAPDILCGGTPCQSFSVAGKRKSLADARGNLALTFCNIADEIDAVRFIHGRKPVLVFWENVPGVLTTSDNAFGCFLGELVGSEFPIRTADGRFPCSGVVGGRKRLAAWRVLDAQYYGIPQRRRRVFLLASDIGRGGANPAEILFERHSLPRDSEESQGARKGVAEGTEGRADPNDRVIGSLTTDLTKYVTNENIRGGVYALEPFVREPSEALSEAILRERAKLGAASTEAGTKPL